MSGGSLCKVVVVKFPAGINHKLLFVIITMINTIYDISTPAENCTGRNKQASCLLKEVKAGLDKVWLF